MAKTASFGSMLSLEKQKSRSSHERAKQALYDAYVESERSLPMNGYKLDLVVKFLEVHSLTRVNFTGS